MQSKLIRYAAIIAAFLALGVVMLGAYTRLTDAGLGCPDWPGCYGHIVLPSAQDGLESAQNNYPQIPIEARKAWTEMAHRYAAGILGLLIFFIAGSLLWRRIQGSSSAWKLPLSLLILLIFQALLGMWTVTLKLLPVVVMGHLLGGILIFACLCRLNLQLNSRAASHLKSWSFWVLSGLLLVFFQIALGGWVSSNYAGIACIGFPQCNGQWLPDLHFSQGFNLFSPVGANYQGGVLDNEIRVTIQFIHRLGAIVVAIYTLVLASLMIIKMEDPLSRLFAKGLIVLILSQFILGIVNVVYLLPLWAAVAHNGVAALLLACMFMIQGRVSDAR